MIALRPPVKNGGKFFLHKWILEHFPEDYQSMSYCEPFCAGASVFLNKEASSEEMISDSDPGVIAIFKALRDEPKEFISKIKKTHYKESTFEKALNTTQFNDYIDHAVNEFLLRQLSQGGRKLKFSASEPSAKLAQHLKTISKRLQNTTILQADFRDIIKVWDEETTLFYFDPPYMRNEPRPNDMTADDHMNLLNFCKTVRGKVVISSRCSTLYNHHLTEWKSYRKTVRFQGKRKRHVECLWTNY